MLILRFAFFYYTAGFNFCSHKNPGKCTSECILFHQVVETKRINVNNRYGFFFFFFLAKFGWQRVQCTHSPHTCSQVHQEPVRGAGLTPAVSCCQKTSVYLSAAAVFLACLAAGVSSPLVFSQATPSSSQKSHIKHERLAIDCVCISFNLLNVLIRINKIFI